MSVRSLNGLSNSGLRSLNGLNNLSNIKIKYDYDSSVLDGDLLIGNKTTNYFQTNRLTAGSNINILNSSSSITLNLDNSLVSINDINGYNANLATVNSATNQILLKTSAVGAFSNDDYLIVNSEGKVSNQSKATLHSEVHSTLFGGNNITKVLNTPTTGDITFNLDADLFSIASINGYNLSITLNTATNQFLLKDVAAGAFTDGDFLIVENNKVGNKTLSTLKTEVFNSITAGTGLNKSGTDNITLNIDTNLQGLTVLQLNANSDVLGGIIRLNAPSGGQANTNQFELLNAYNSSGFQSGKIDSGVRIRSQSIDKLFCGHQQDNNECVYINPDNTTNFIFNFNQFKMIKQDNSSADFNIGVGGSTSSLIFNLIDGSTTDTHKFSFRSGNVEKAFVSSTGKGYLNKLSLGTATTFNTNDTLLLEQSGLSQFTIHSSGGNEPRINFKKSNNVIGSIKIDSNNFLNYNISTGNSHIFTVNSVGKFKIENTQTTITTDNTKTIFNTGGNITISHLSSTHISPIIKCDTGTLNFDSSNGSTQAIDFSLSGSETLLIRNDKVEVKKNLVIDTFNINTTDCDINNNGDITGTNCDIRLDGDLVFQHTSGSVDIKGTSSSLDINFTIARTFNFYRPTAHFDQEIRLRSSTDINHVVKYTNDEAVDGALVKGNLGGLLRSQQYGTHARWRRVGTENRFESNHFSTYSDDRIKYGETTITNALSTIKKINPVSYRKTNGLGEADSPTLDLEWGIIAQELYNNVPEMKHAVIFDKTLKRNFVNDDLNGNCVNDIWNYSISSDNIITTGPDVVALQYDNFHALNIKAIQELLLRVETLENILFRKK